MSPLAAFANFLLRLSPEPSTETQERCAMCGLFKDKGTLQTLRLPKDHQPRTVTACKDCRDTGNVRG
jgi:hypothetical protein